MLSIVGCDSSDKTESAEEDHTESCDQCADGPNLDFQAYGEDSDNVSFQDGDNYDVYEITGNPKIIFVYSNPSPENNNHV